MFWKKEKQLSMSETQSLSYPYRFCDLHISEKYKQILFVPFRKVSEGIYAEVGNLIIDSWPCKFADLQVNIEEALSRFSTTAIRQEKWPSFQHSKAKSQQSFEADYIRLRLETDKSRSYKDGEVERIKVTARPTLLDNTYSLTGCAHLIDTKVAQVVIDIFEGCMKIRTN